MRCGAYDHKFHVDNGRKMRKKCTKMLELLEKDVLNMSKQHINFKIIIEKKNVTTFDIFVQFKTMIYKVRNDDKLKLIQKEIDRKKL